MKRIKLSNTGAMLLILALWGCATTTDPSQGGFFDGIYGLSSGAYQNRANEKRTTLGALQSEGDQLRGENRALNRQADTLELQEQQYRSQLSQLRTDLAGLQSRLRKAKVQNVSQQARKKDLERRLGTLQDEVRAREGQGKTGAAQNQEDLQRMRGEKDRLQEDILRLTSQ